MGGKTSSPWPGRKMKSIGDWEKVMTQAFAAVWEKGQEKGTTLRMGAYIAGY